MISSQKIMHTKTGFFIAGFFIALAAILSPYNTALAVYPASCCSISSGGFSQAPTEIDYNWSCTGGPCDSGGGGGGGAGITYPTATLSANPGSITQGGTSKLTWSSTGATSCAGTNFSTGNATSGSVNVSPLNTTVYGLTCVNSQASATAGTTVTVTNGGNTQIRYGIDWDKNGTVDTYVPSSGYTNLGTLQTSPHSWSTTGTKTFQARTEDNNGNVSAWASYTITISAPECSDGIDNDGNGLKDYPADTGCSSANDTDETGGVIPSVSCSVTPTTVATGGSATYTATPANGATGPYTWTASDGLSGLGTGSTATRTFSGLGTYGMSVRATGALNPSATCPQVNANTCSGTKTGTITASPTRVNSGGTATLTWSAQNITTSCIVSGPGVSQTTPAASCAVPNANITTPAITTQSVYTLTCDGTVLGTAIVNVVPKIEEF